MAAKNGPPGLRRLMERARGHDEPAGDGDAAGGWPGRPPQPAPTGGNRSQPDSREAADRSSGTDLTYASAVALPVESREISDESGRFLGGPAG